MSRLVFFDVETTGVEEDDRLVELAYKVHGEPEGRVERFKAPKPMSSGASAVTGISNKMLENCPVFVESEMWKQMLEWSDDPETIFVAHNATFDIKMLAREGIDIKRHICTMKVTHYFDKKGELTQYKLQVLRYHYGIEVEGEAHSALGDVLVLEAYFEYLNEKNPLEAISVNRMLALSERPILFKKWPNFGKWKNTPMGMVPPDYMRWCKDNIDMSEDLAYTVKRWLLHYEKLAAKK